MSVKSEHPDRPSEMVVGGVCEIHPDIRLFFGRRFRSVAPQSWRERGSSDAVVRFSAPTHLGSHKLDRYTTKT